MKKYYLAALLASFVGAGTLFAADIEVMEPFAKATPPNAPATGIFMEIKNNSKEDIALVSASNSITDVTEIHTHLEEKGMKKMVQIPKIDIKAGKTAHLKPGGMHIMVMDLKKGVKEGDKINLKLNFDNGESVEVKDIVAKKLQPMKSMKH